MIRLVLIVGISFVMTIATLFIDTTELRTEDGADCAGIPEFCSDEIDFQLSDRGFPVEFVDEKVENLNEVSSFNIVNFGISWVFWIGVASIGYMLAAFVLKQFGRVALAILLALYAGGYSLTLVGL